MVFFPSPSPKNARVPFSMYFSLIDHESSSAPSAFDQSTLDDYLGHHLREMMDLETIEPILPSFYKAI